MPLIVTEGGQAQKDTALRTTGEPLVWGLERFRLCPSFTEQVAKQRQDSLNQRVCRLVCGVGGMAVENVSVKRMVKGNFATSILDVGWGLFWQRLRSKAANAVRTVVLVDAASTTPACCPCGHRQEFCLWKRWYWCSCGNCRHRDKNAAWNV